MSLNRSIRIWMLEGGNEVDSGESPNQQIACSRLIRIPDTFSQLGCREAMTTQAKSADIFEVAFTASFDYGNDVVGVPQSLARPCAKAPEVQKGNAMGAPGEAKLACCGNRIDSAEGAHAAIALKHLLAQICGLTAEFPLVDAEL